MKEYWVEGFVTLTILTPLRFTLPLWAEEDNEIAIKATNKNKNVRRMAWF